MSTKFLKKLLSLTLVMLLVLPQPAIAQSVLNLPAVGTMVQPSISYTPVMLSGMTLNPDKPLEYDFIINGGDDDLQGEELAEESQKLINYFFTTLAVPEDEMWVNLSPYEKDRIIADGLSVTAMGRDMLAQDYMLKQLTASLMYPEEELGGDFWKRVYAKKSAKFASVDIPTNTFNKVWIIPSKATVYINDNNIFVSESHLKVMLEKDYLAQQKGASDLKQGVSTEDEVTNQLIREIIIPEIEREVNEGKNFANLRQIYNAMILATWYKKNLKESILGRVYMDMNKIDGVDLEDKTMKAKIYKQYVAAFEKGVFDYIKEDYNSVTQEITAQKYFSGGLENVDSAMIQEETQPSSLVRRLLSSKKGHNVRVNLTLERARGLLQRVLEPLKSNITDATPKEVLGALKASAWSSLKVRALVMISLGFTALSSEAQLKEVAKFYKVDKAAALVTSSNLEREAAKKQGKTVDLPAIAKVENISEAVKAKIALELNTALSGMLSNYKKKNGELVSSRKYSQLAKVANGANSTDFEVVFKAIREHMNVRYQASPRGEALKSLGAIEYEIAQWTSELSVFERKYSLKDPSIETALKKGTYTCDSCTNTHLLTMGQAITKKGVASKVFITQMKDGSAVDYMVPFSPGHTVLFLKTSDGRRTSFDQGQEVQHRKTIFYNDNLETIEIEGWPKAGDSFSLEGLTLSEVQRAMSDNLTVNYLIDQINDIDANSDGAAPLVDSMGNQYNTLKQSPTFKWHPVQRNNLNTLIEALLEKQKIINSPNTVEVKDEKGAKAVEDINATQASIVRKFNTSSGLYNKNNASLRASKIIDEVIAESQVAITKLPKIRAYNSLRAQYADLIAKSNKMKIEIGLGIVRSRFNEGVTLYNKDNKSPKANAILKEVSRKSKAALNSIPKEYTGIRKGFEQLLKTANGIIGDKAALSTVANVLALVAVTATTSIAEVEPILIESVNTNAAYISTFTYSSVETYSTLSLVSPSGKNVSVIVGAMSNPEGDVYSFDKPGSATIMPAAQPNYNVFDASTYQKPKGRVTGLSETFSNPITGMMDLVRIFYIDAETGAFKIVENGTIVKAPTTWSSMDNPGQLLLDTLRSNPAFRDAFLQHLKNNPSELGSIFFKSATSNLSFDSLGASIKSELSSLSKNWVIATLAATGLLMTRRKREDAAAITPLGGIDFNADALDLRVEGESFNFEGESFNSIDIDPSSIQGATPVIINITPITNFAPLLGAVSRDKELLLVKQNE